MTPHPLSKAAVEAAEKAYRETPNIHGLGRPMNAALSAAFEQSRIEGNAREAECISDTVGAWTAYEQNYGADFFSVLIIRNAKP